MADKKISALTAATTPLVGTEVLPIVQGGATVKVAVSNLTAGRAISATRLTLSTGNLIVSSGQGIDFSATPGTGTSELLDDYEEGTWTPVFTNCGTASASSAKYTKVGRLVTIQLTMTATSIVANSSFFSLPFTSGATSSGTYTRNTLEGGFVEVQASTSCYFSSTPLSLVGSFVVTATFSV